MLKYTLILICFISLPCFALDWRDERGWFYINTEYGYVSGIEKAQFFNGEDWVDMSVSYTNGTVHYFSCTPDQMISLVQSLNPVYFRITGDDSNPFCKTYVFNNPNGHSFFSVDYYLSDGNSSSRPSFNVTDGRLTDVLINVLPNSYTPPHVADISNMHIWLPIYITAVSGVLVGVLAASLSFLLVDYGRRKIRGIVND